jgi:thioesterase domain-containing protein
VWVSEVPFTAEALFASARHEQGSYPSISDMAASHCALIRGSGWQGPCVVAGFSYGGVLAFEVARQLERLGTVVKAVFILDADIRPPLSERCRQWIQRHSQSLARKGMNHLWHRLQVRRDRKRTEKTTRMAARHSPGFKLETVALASFQERWPLIDRIWRAGLEHYRPGRIQARGVLFRAQDNGEYYSAEQDYDGCLGWKGLFAGGLQVAKVSGDHFSMLREPHVSVLRQAWQSTLDDLQGKPEKDR